MSTKFLAVPAFLLMGLVPASAHHSLAPYDRFTALTIEGTVESYRWSNPHVRIFIKALGHDGAVKFWDIESGSVGRLSTAGFRKNTLAKGDKVSVSFYPRKDGGSSGFLISVTAPDGRVLDATRKGSAERRNGF